MKIHFRPGWKLKETQALSTSAYKVVLKPTKKENTKTVSIYFSPAQPRGRILANIN
jgi:hypothetical protein